MTLRFSVLLLVGALLLSCYNSSGNTDTPAPPVSTGFCQVRDGVLYGPDGREILLWGVNFQTPLSWEVNRLAKAGVERSGAALNAGPIAVPLGEFGNVTRLEHAVLHPQEPRLLRPLGKGQRARQAQAEQQGYGPLHLHHLRCLLPGTRAGFSM